MYVIIPQNDIVMVHNNFHPIELLGFASYWAFAHIIAVFPYKTMVK